MYTVPANTIIENGGRHPELVDKRFLDETANYYKRLLKLVIPYVEDLLDKMPPGSEHSYYNNKQGEIITSTKVKDIINNLKSASYGATD